MKKGETFQSFFDEYFDNLRDKSCIETSLEALCGGCKFNVPFLKLFRDVRNI